MCGVAGMIDARLIGEAEQLQLQARAMGRAIAHRGPDGEGVWIDADAGLALSHRRLAIIDLSPAGAQPMVSSDERWVICYNGEIYNAEDMRRDPELSSIAWRGHSDTEVILESIARRGIDRTIDDINGMFAIALWDRKTRSLHLVRDRLGIKPLFLSIDGGRILFASELKALHAAGISRNIDASSVASFLRFGYVPTPHSIYRNVEKIAPGEIVTVRDGKVTRRQYWSALNAARNGVASQLVLSDDEAVEQLTALLQDAVSRQMLSDVPLGAFLSGGIDSSAVVAFMVRAGRGPVRTFSIGFPEFGFDESKDAAAVARHLGTEHTELIVSAADALAVVPHLAEMYDEPFADSSQIPTHLVSKLTREHVIVALSGDGGDELFAGYNRYRLADGMWRQLSMLPRGLRRGIGGVLNSIPMPVVDGIANLLPSRFVPPQAADKLRKFANVMPLGQDEIYLRLVSQCENPGALSPLAPEHEPWPQALREGTELPTFLDRMQLLDTVTYLPDDILQKVDRASMAVALEARPPLLDHRVMEFAWQLPARFKIRNGESKWLLRRVAEQYVPRELLDRPKMGFGIPLAAWLRGPLRDWAEGMLDPRTFGGNLIDPVPVQRLWTEHLSGRRNWAYALWTVLMFEAWRRRWAAG
ncbi:asparagine synthase (glutamine-hydrolyzing) [soil metagenome]